MQQTDMANLIHTTINANNSIGKVQVEKTAPQAKSGKKSSLLNAAKEVGITAGMGVTSGLIAGGITSLIPVKNTDNISNLLCDTFIKSSLNEMNLAEEKIPDVSFENAQEQLQKAKEYIKAQQAFDNDKLSGEALKTAEQKLSDTVFALKESSIEYINKAAKGDELLNFAKKAAKKVRTINIMKNSISIGLSTAFIVLLFNMLGGMFNKKDGNK